MFIAAANTHNPLQNNSVMICQVTWQTTLKAKTASLFFVMEVVMYSPILEAHTNIKSTASIHLAEEVA